jgi:hypothetical protein
MSDKSRSYLLWEASVHEAKVAAASQPPPGTRFRAGQATNGHAVLVRESSELFAAPASSLLRWLARMAVNHLPRGDQLFATAEEEAERSRQFAYSAGKALLVVASAPSSETAQHIAEKHAHLFRTASGTVWCDISSSSVRATINGSEFHLETNQTQGRGLATPNPAEITFTDCIITDPRKQQFLLSSIPPTPAIEFSRDLKAALDHAQWKLAQPPDGCDISRQL